jgi:molecular chaperone DnaK (HSP70)
MPKLKTFALATLLALSPALPAMAQAPSPAQPPAGSSQDLTALLMEVDQIERRLAEIQRQAIVQNPELRDQARELQGLLVETMRAEGYSPEERLSRIQELQIELNRPGLSQAEREAMISEAETEQQQLSEAEQAALEHAEVQQAAADFENRLLTAMKEQDPNTEGLIEQYEERTAQLQGMLTQPPTQMR